MEKRLPPLGNYEGTAGSQMRNKITKNLLAVEVSGDLKLVKPFERLFGKVV